MAIYTDRNTFRGVFNSFSIVCSFGSVSSLVWHPCWVFNVGGVIFHFLCLFERWCFVVVCLVFWVVWVLQKFLFCLAGLCVSIV